MGYEKHDYKSGEKLYAWQLNEMDEQIAQNESRIERGYFPVMTDGLTMEGQKVPFAFKPLDKGYVSFVFDDLRDTVDSVASIFEEYNMPVCLAAIPARMGVHATGLTETRGSYVPDMMMYEICFKVEELGGEIMAHCANVINVTNQYDYDFMYDHFFTTKKEFADWGINTRGMVRAGGIDQISKSKEITRWVKGTYEYSNYGDEANHDLQRETVNQSMDTVKALIRSAAENKTWLRLMGHDYEYGGGETFTGEDDLREILSYCQEMGVGVVTYAHMIDTFGTTELENRIDQQTVKVSWKEVDTLDESARLTVLEAARPILTAATQAVLDSIPDGGSATLTVEDTDYTLRRLGEITDTLMFHSGTLNLCRKIAEDATSLLIAPTFEPVACTDMTALFDRFELPCTVDNLLSGKVSQVSYAACGAYLDGVHDDYEAMHRAHYIGDLCSCDVVQHGGTIYKANSGWLHIKNHNVDLSGSTVLIDAYNRYGFYWLSASSAWELEEETLATLRGEMVEHSTYWPTVETGYPANGLFVLTHPAATTRYDGGTVTQADRVEIVRHASDGRVYSSVIDDAGESTTVQFLRYPATQLTFRGCTLSIDISMASVAMYFMRCERSNAVIRDFVIDPSRRTTMNTGYRGSVFMLNKCADVVMENIKGINIAGKPSESYPSGVSGYLLNATSVLDLVVRDCNMLGYWGSVGLNGAKEVTFEGCEMNRVDIHDYFRNLTVQNCRIDGQTINIGYGKGTVNIQGCSIKTDQVHQVVNMRCDYGQYFRGVINLCNVDAVYNGSGSFDLVSGVTLYSEESATATGLTVDRYPVIHAANVLMWLLGESYAGYMLNMPADLETAINVGDTRKVIDYVNIAVFDENGDPQDIEVCPLGGVIQNQAAVVEKMQEIFGINAGENQQIDRTVRPDKHVPKDLLNIPMMKVYVQASNYAYALYSIDPAQTYYVTGSAHKNAEEYPVGGFYDADGVLISMFGTTASEVYTKQPVQPPENAVLMAVNKTLQAQEIEVTVKVTLTGSALLDSVIAQAEETETLVEEFLEQYEKDNTPSIGPAITPESSAEGQIYDVIAAEGYGDESVYGHSFYAVTGGNRYFVTCASATNVDNYPGGAFYDEYGNLLTAICDDPLTKYEDQLVKAPAAAARLVLNKNSGIASTVCKTAIESAEKSAAVQSYDLNMADAMIRLEKKNPFVFKAFDKGYVSFVFDDLLSDIDGIAATFEEYGVPLCVAAIPEKLDNIATGVAEARGSYAAKMSMREIMQQVVALGGEIMAHNTDVITEESQYDYEYMYAHVVNCKKSLETAGFKPCGFIRAGGEGAVSSSDEIQRWLAGNFVYSNQGTLPQYSLERVSINQSLDEIKATMDACAEGKTWVRFMCHGYDFGNGETFASEDDLRAILDYAQERGLGIVTYAHMFANYGSTEHGEAMSKIDELEEADENQSATVNGFSAELNDYSVRLAALEESMGNVTPEVEYLYYSKRTLVYEAANTNIRLTLPYEETEAIYKVTVKVLTGYDVQLTVTDWTTSYVANDGDVVYIKMPSGAMNTGKVVIFAVYPASNVGSYELVVERTAETDAYTGEIQVDFAGA